MGFLPGGSSPSGPSSEEVSAFLSEAGRKHSARRDAYAELGALYERKHWHQLTVTLLQLVSASGGVSGAEAVELFTRFVTGFQNEMNRLSLAKLALAAADGSDGAEGAAKLLGDCVEFISGAQGGDPREPVTLLRIKEASIKLHRSGDWLGCKRLLGECEEVLKGMLDVDPSVHAAFHKTESDLAKSKGDYNTFYRSALKYLAFVALDDLLEEEREALALDLAVSALVGTEVYSLGELLGHPICGALEASKCNAWLLVVIRAFNAGDIPGYDKLCVQYATQMGGNDILVEHAQELRQKATILSLLNLVFSRPAGEREVSFSDISTRTGLAIPEVELLLMKALSLGLIQGIVDQIDATVQISWCQPQVLSRAQVGKLRERMVTWTGKVQKLAALVEHETVELSA